MLRTIYYDLIIIIIAGILILPVIIKQLWNTFIVKQESINNQLYIDWFTPIIIISSMLCYIFLVIYSASTARFDTIGTRFFAPIYPKIIFLFVFFVYHFLILRYAKVISIVTFSAILLVVVHFDLARFFQRDFSTVKHHNSLGFLVSETKYELNKWLEDLREKERDRINISVFADHRQDMERPHVSRAFLFRPELFGFTQIVSYRPEDQNLTAEFWTPDEKQFTVDYLSWIDREDFLFKIENFHKPFALLVNQDGLDAITKSGGKRICDKCYITQINAYFGIFCP